MVVGTLSLRLIIAGAHSLKEKRRALRSIKDRLRHQFNVSVAEVDGQDYWQSAVLGIAAVGTDRAFVEGLLNQVIRMVQSNRHVDLAGYETEFT